MKILPLIAALLFTPVAFSQVSMSGNVVVGMPGPQGPAGTNGTNGTNGVPGPNCSVSSPAGTCDLGTNTLLAGGVTAASVLAKGIPEFSPEIFASSADGHSGLDYCYAINQAYAFIKATFPQTRETIKLSGGQHSCWSTVYIDGPIELSGNGAILVPKSGGASGVWGSAAVTLSSCTRYPLSPVLTCSSNTGVTLHMHARGTGIPSGAYVTCVGLWTNSSCVTDSTHVTMSLPAQLEIVGQSATSTTITGINLLNSVTTGMYVTGPDVPSSTTISSIHYGGSSQYDTQSITLSNATTKSTQTDILQVASPWTASATFQSYAPVVQFSWSTNCINSIEGPCIQGGIRNLHIFDTTWGTISGVNGVMVSGWDHMPITDLQVQGITGAGLILGGQMSSGAVSGAPNAGRVRESNLSQILLSSDGAIGMPAMQIMTGIPDCDPSYKGTTCKNPDETNQIGISQITDDINNGPNLLIGTYNPAHYLGSVITVPSASPSCSVSSNVVTLNVTNTLSANQRIYVSGFTGNCAFLNGNTYILSSPTGSTLVFPLYTGFTHADTTDATAGSVNQDTGLTAFGPRLIWFDNNCQFEMISEKGPTGSISLSESPQADNVIVRSSSNALSFSGCEMNDAGYGRFVFHSYGDGGVKIGGGTRVLAQQVGQAWTVDTTHAQDATPYVSFTSNVAGNTAFPTDGRWDGIGLLLKASTGTCSTVKGCNVYLANPGVSGDGTKAFLAVALVSGATLGASQTLTTGQPPFYAAFEASTVVPDLTGSSMNGLLDTTYQLYLGNTIGGGNKLWGGTYPSFTNYQAVVDFESSASSFPFGGMNFPKLPVGNNATWRICIDNLSTGECGYMAFENLGGTTDPSNLNDIYFGFTQGTGVTPLRLYKTGDAHIGHDLAVVHDTTVGNDLTVTHNVTANNVVNALASYQVNGVAKTFNPLRAGAWTISSSTTVAVTFATAMSSTPSSCQLTTSASTATTGVPFATALATTGFTVNVPTSGTISGTYSCTLNNAN